jgi:hypothetical protein
LDCRGAATREKELESCEIEAPGAVADDVAVAFGVRDDEFAAGGWGEQDQCDESAKERSNREDATHGGVLSGEV